jgi:hypothetical protein
MRSEMTTTFTTKTVRRRRVIAMQLHSTQRMPTWMSQDEVPNQGRRRLDDLIASLETNLREARRQIRAERRRSHETL